eukprot:TRINITY_DN9692_c0_g1_i1.p1 TRINITY_DN9692_c0_g1~~TRINITY_DN9692_c0_g1_i1.p1  ORF type:complete len:847 (+),score=175.30 TRINITY_DN9692_c0_g1_i1:109-2649(+)
MSRSRLQQQQDSAAQGGWLNSILCGFSGTSTTCGWCPAEEESLDVGDLVSVPEGLSGVVVEVYPQRGLLPLRVLTLDGETRWYAETKVSRLQLGPAETLKLRDELQRVQKEESPKQVAKGRRSTAASGNGLSGAKVVCDSDCQTSPSMGYGGAVSSASTGLHPSQAQASRSSQLGMFAVDIDRSRGSRLGIDIEHRDGRTLEVVHVSGDGLICRWNQLNPSKQVHTGDIIIEVNGVRGNSEQLVRQAERLSPLNIIVRRAVDPASDAAMGEEVGSFTVAGVSRHLQSESQLEFDDEDDNLLDEENLSPESLYSIILDKSRGGRLGAQVDHENGRTLLIQSIGYGLLEEWNKFNMDRRVSRGDRIIEVNGIRGDSVRLVNECCKNQLLRITLQVPSLIADRPAVHDDRADRSTAASEIQRTSRDGLTQDMHAAAPPDLLGTDRAAHGQLNVEGVRNIEPAAEAPVLMVSQSQTHDQQDAVDAVAAAAPPWEAVFQSPLPATDTGGSTTLLGSDVTAGPSSSPVGCASLEFDPDFTEFQMGASTAAPSIAASAAMTTAPEDPFADAGLTAATQVALPSGALFEPVAPASHLTPAPLESVRADVKVPSEAQEFFTPMASTPAGGFQPLSMPVAGATLAAATPEIGAPQDAMLAGELAPDEPEAPSAPEAPLVTLLAATDRGAEGPREAAEAAGEAKEEAVVHVQPEREKERQSQPCDEGEEDVFASIAAAALAQASASRESNVASAAPPAEFLAASAATTLAADGSPRREEIPSSIILDPSHALSSSNAPQDLETHTNVGEADVTKMCTSGMMLAPEAESPVTETKEVEAFEMAPEKTPETGHHFGDDE